MFNSSYVTYRDPYYPHFMGISADINECLSAYRTSMIAMRLCESKNNAVIGSAGFALVYPEEKEKEALYKKMLKRWELLQHQPFLVSGLDFRQTLAQMLIATATTGEALLRKREGNNRIVWNLHTADDYEGYRRGDLDVSPEGAILGYVLRTDRRTVRRFRKGSIIRFYSKIYQNGSLNKSVRGYPILLPCVALLGKYSRYSEATFNRIISLTRKLLVYKGSAHGVKEGTAQSKFDPPNALTNNTSVQKVEVDSEGDLRVTDHASTHSDELGFVKQQLQMICASFGLSFAHAMMVTDGSNYSSLKVAKNSDVEAVAVWQAELINRVIRPVYDVIVFSLLRNDDVTYREATDLIDNASFKGPRSRPLDAEKTVKALDTAVKAGLIAKEVAEELIKGFI